MRHSLLVASLLVAACGCGKSEAEPLVSTAPATPTINEYVEKETEAAISRARSEMNTFIAELANPRGSEHAVKVAIEDKGQTEYFWLTDVSFKNDEFTGTIDNKPNIIGNVKLGQSWTVKKSEISDWMFMRDGQLRGNYTLAPQLKTKPGSSNHPAMPGMIGG